MVRHMWQEDSLSMMKLLVFWCQIGKENLILFQRVYLVFSFENMVWVSTALLKGRPWGSKPLFDLSDSDTKVIVCHATLQGSSQQNFGRDGTRKADILHNSSSCVCLTADDDCYKFLSFLDHKMYFYILMFAFLCAQSFDTQSCSSNTGPVS